MTRIYKAGAADGVWSLEVQGRRLIVPIINNDEWSKLYRRYVVVLKFLFIYINVESNNHTF